MRASRFRRRLALGAAGLAFAALSAALWYILRRTLDPQTRGAPLATAPASAGSADEPAASIAPTPPFERQLPDELRARPETRAIRDSTPEQIKNIYNSDARPRLIQTAFDLDRVLAGCLLKNLCGQKPGDDHAYFAPDRTPAHRLLNHALEVLRLASHDDPALGRRIDLLRQLALTNGDTQSTLIEIYLSQPPSEAEYDDLLARAPVLVQQARARLFIALQSPEFTPPTRRTRYIEALTEALRRDDNATNHLVQNLGELNLSESEFRQATAPLCRYQASSLTHQNWLQAKHFIERATAVRGYALTPDQICDTP